MDEFFFFSFKQSIYRYTSPFCHHCGNVFGGHFFFKHMALLLELFKPFVFLFKFLFQLNNFAIADFGNLAQVAASFGPLLFHVCFIDLRLDVTNLLDNVFFQLPLTLHGVELVIEFGQLSFQFVQPLF